MTIHGLTFCLWAFPAIFVFVWGANMDKDVGKKPNFATIIFIGSIIADFTLFCLINAFHAVFS